jgi:glycosyltransferase involved in cell wall biosynthesis
VKKVANIISDVDKALAFEWIGSKLNTEFNLFFILIGKEKSELSEFFAKNEIRFYVLDEHKYKSFFSQWLQLFLILKKEKPLVVHTHLWRANLLGLSASWLLGIPKRIFTRHHATIHYTQYPSGRKWDKLCNFLATDIVAISKNIEEILLNWDRASKNKLHLIHHGFDFNYFDHVDEDQIEVLKKKYALTNYSPVVGVISRYTHYKGIQYIIPGFLELLKKYPRAHLVLANAKGDYQNEIKSILKTLPLGSYTEIPFESNLALLYKLFDIYVHVPIDKFSEAFGQTYVEALIAKVPSVFTLSGVAQEFITNNENALVVNFKSSTGIFESMNRLLSDESLRNNLIKTGRQSIEQFNMDSYILKLKNLYNK